MVYTAVMVKKNIFSYNIFSSNLSIYNCLKKVVLDFLKEAFIRIEFIHAKLCWNIKENVQLIKLIEISVELVDLIDVLK